MGLFKVNDWFDVFNSRVPKIDFRPRMAAYGLSMAEHNSILNKMEFITREMRIGEKKTLMPFQKGILNNITAIKMLYADLKEMHNISYLLTYRLNQDPLEMFFGMMRAKGGLFDHPTALHFKYRLRNILLGRNESIMSKNANVQEDEDGDAPMEIDLTTVNVVEDTVLLEDDMANTDNLSEDLGSVTSNLLKDLAISKSPENEPDEELLSELEYDGLEHLSGYILYRLHNKIPQMTEKYCDSKNTNFTWTNQLTRRREGYKNQI